MFFFLLRISSYDSKELEGNFVFVVVLRALIQPRDEKLWTWIFECPTVKFQNVTVSNWYLFPPQFRQIRKVSHNFRAYNVDIHVTECFRLAVSWKRKKIPNFRDVQSGTEEYKISIFNLENLARDWFRGRQSDPSILWCGKSRRKDVFEKWDLSKYFANIVLL